MSRYIEVIDYQDNWPLRYLAEVRLLRPIFGSALFAIDHIGSTSIPGIRAKPIIDILAQIESESDIHEFYPDMEEIGYHCRGECLDAVVPGTPGRHYFTRDKDGKRDCHVHVCHAGHFQIRELLALRDYLRDHPHNAAAYGDLKTRLAAQFAYDNVGYMRGKDRFIKQLISRALTWTGFNITS